MMQIWQLWQTTPVLMILSFPMLYAVLLLFVHGVVEFAPRCIRQHRVSYRPIQTRVADLVLIIRLVFQKQ